MSAPALEEIGARVRDRLARTRDHLRRQFAGRDADLLYAWGVAPADGPSPGQVIPASLAPDWAAARLGLNWSPLQMPVSQAPRPGAHFAPASPQGLAYLTAMQEWPLPPVAAWRAAFHQAHADMYPDIGPGPLPIDEAWYDTTYRTGDDPARFAAALDHHLRAAGALAPDALPLRMTIAEGFARLDAEAARLAADTATDILDGLQFVVTRKLRAAVGARETLVMRWPWPWRTPPGRVLTILSALADTVPSGELAPGAWPAEVAPLDVATWAAPLLAKTHPDIAAALRAEAEEWRTTGRPERVAPVWVSLAVLYATLQAVERDRHRPAVAIDAGRPHHDLLMGWRDLPKDIHTPRATPIRNGRIELLAPGGGCVQLTLDLDGDGSPSEALITALRDMRGWKGLRHWAAVQKLLSVDGGRQGWVRWTLDGHLDALGVSVKNRSKADVRVNIARQVEAFTKIDLAVYAEDGTLRTRRPILLVGAKYDRLKGSTWELDGMQLTINPLLYGGVREDRGRLGRNWHPAPVELAQVDDVRHPYTLALGLILPIRWRLALEEGKDQITLTGENALRLAGIPYKAHHRPWLAKNAGRAWDRLERDLAELERIGGLGRWAWDAADTPRTLASRLLLWPAPWMLDRTLHEVRPRELRPGPAVLTGAELKAWRTRRSLTQAKAAETLHVSRPTIARAEAHPLEPLSTTLTGKLREAGA